jgi:hypothetical protein
MDYVIPTPATQKKIQAILRNSGCLSFAYLSDRPSSALPIQALLSIFAFDLSEETQEAV